jgi:zinc protease
MPSTSLFARLPRRTTELVLALALAVAAGAAWARSAGDGGATGRTADAGVVAATDATSRTFDRTLPNGIRVVVREDHRAPVAVHIVMYRVGSMDEGGGRTGVAHLLEHLMFKGTPSHPAGEFSRLVAGMGGRENAFTSNDRTVYFQQIPARGLAKVMALEADRMANLSFDDEAFAREARVVMEERRLRVEDEPLGLLYETLMAQSFLASPARTPVIGWMSDLESLTAGDAREFYSAWYTPGNALVVVAGDVDAGEVFELAERTYGRVADRPVPPRRPQAEPPQRGERRVVVSAPAETPYLVLAFKAPRLDSLDGPVDPFALAMLAAVLDADENGRLTRELVRGSRVASSVGASWDFLGRAPALFLLSGRPAPGVEVEALERALREQVARIARDGVDASELERIRTQYVAGRIYQRDSIFSQAMEIVNLEAAGLSWSDADAIIERVRAVTADEVRDVAARYFGDEGLTAARLHPLPLEPSSRPAPSVPGLRH